MTLALADSTRDGRTSIDDVVRAPFERMREAQRRTPAPSYAERRERLDALLALVQDHRPQIEQAVSADFGGRSCHETRLAEVYFLVSTIKYVRAHLRGWMKPRARSMPLVLLPARAKVLSQPLGVVGVIAPWNYPLQLALGPLAYALAAGNRVLLKPSEYAPQTSELLRSLVRRSFDASTCCTSSPATRASAKRSARCRSIICCSPARPRSAAWCMRAAAENLSPVTLELGGKSPAIVHDTLRDRARGRTHRLRQVVQRRPDLHRARLRARAREQARRVRRARWCAAHAHDLSDDRGQPGLHVDHQRRATIARLRGLIDDAVQRGARSDRDQPRGRAAARGAAPASRRRCCSIVNDDMSVMQEEIFGPMLPIVTYRTLDEAIAYVNERPRPLALYYFDDDAARVRACSSATISGGAVDQRTS